MNKAHDKSPALVIFAKRPRLGHGKQRLAEETTPETALRIAQTLLLRTLEVAEKWPGDLIFSPSTQTDSDWTKSLCERPLICIPQKPGTLGQRLMQVDQSARAMGYDHVLFIGTDAPLLEITDLTNAQKYFATHDQIFIPASDGGVVLMASKLPWSKLDCIDWSTEKVLTQLKSNAHQQGLSVKLLTEQIDLDDLNAYKKLRPTLLTLEKNPYSELDKFI